MKKDEFKVGDTVYCTMYGKGVVECIDEDRDYPVSVTLESGRIKAYTKDGKFYVEGNRVLFFEEIPIPKSDYVRPRWRAEKDCDYYFINGYGEVQCFSDEKTNRDNKLYDIGNYFQTEKEAKQSKLYKVFHEVEDEN